MAYSCARRSLLALTNCIALVIWRVFLMDLIRCLRIIVLAILNLPPRPKPELQPLALRPRPSCKQQFALPAPGQPLLQPLQRLQRLALHESRLQPETPMLPLRDLAASSLAKSALPL